MARTKGSKNKSKKLIPASAIKDLHKEEILCNRLFYTFWRTVKELNMSNSDSEQAAKKFYKEVTI